MALKRIPKLLVVWNLVKSGLRLDICFALILRIRPIIMIIIMIIALKGAIRDFYNLLVASRTVSNMYAQVARTQLRAAHRALITCSMSFAPCGTKGQVRY